MTAAATVLAGSITIDTQQFLDGRRQTQLGGVPTYGGAALAKHGCPPTAVSSIPSMHLQRVHEILATLGVDVVAGNSREMTSYENVATLDGAGSKQISSVSDSVQGALIPDECLAPVGILHLGPLHADDLEDSVFERAATSDGTVSLDIQGYFRSSIGGGIPPLTRLRRALHAAHIVKAERSELHSLIGLLGMGIPDLMETFSIRELIETAGADGGTVHVCGRRPLDYAAVRSASARDTTGAGDVFAAVYVHARVRRQFGLEGACKFAATAATLQVSGQLVRAGDLAYVSRSSEP